MIVLLIRNLDLNSRHLYFAGLGSRHLQRPLQQCVLRTLSSTSGVYPVQLGR